MNARIEFLDAVRRGARAAELDRLLGILRAEQRVRRSARAVAAIAAQIAQRDTGLRPDLADALRAALDLLEAAR